MVSLRLAAILAFLVQFVHAEDGDDVRFPTKRARRPPVQCSSAETKYSYDKNSFRGPFNWPQISSCCGGDWQSPITIHSSQTVCSQHFRVYHTQYPTGRVQAKLYNSGHAAKVSFDSYPQIALHGVPYSMGSDYVLDSLHIHVGNVRGSGSEHRVNGIGYDAEIHLVHYKRQYGSMDAASFQPDGLAVIGVFLQQAPFSPNTELNQLIRSVSRLGNMIGRKVPISLDPRLLVPPSGRFYTYPGSLTTPPCSEAVRWMVMVDPISTTQENLNVLRMLPTDEGTLTMRHTNVRPPVLSGSRPVESNFNCVG